jgi:hypothetical protein
VFAIVDASFASIPNLLNIGIQSATLVLLLPMTLIIMSEGLDLSMGAVLGLAGIVLATMLARGSSLPMALVAALAVGTTFGTANGVLVVTLDSPFLRRWARSDQQGPPSPRPGAAASSASATRCRRVRRTLGRRAIFDRGRRHRLCGVPLCSTDTAGPRSSPARYATRVSR